MKYRKGFTEGFNWFITMRKKFTFSGDYLRVKNGDILKVTHDQKGCDARQAFFTYESTGKLLPTKHPLLFEALLKTKASANWHVKELYARDRGSFLLSGFELEEIYQEIKPPQWFKDAVRNFTVKWRAV